MHQLHQIWLVPQQKLAQFWRDKYLYININTITISTKPKYKSKNHTIKKIKPYNLQKKRKLYVILYDYINIYKYIQNSVKQMIK